MHAVVANLRCTWCMTTGLCDRPAPFCLLCALRPFKVWCTSSRCGDDVHYAWTATPFSKQPDTSCNLCSEHSIPPDEEELPQMQSDNPMNDAPLRLFYT